MKLTNTILTLLIGLCLGSCKEDCDETYTITGRFYDSSVDTPYANSRVRLYYVNEKAFDSDDKWQIASVKTDAKGEFQVNYDCVLRADHIDAEYYIGSDYHTINQLPANQDYHDDIILPSQGTVRLYLQSNSPVGINNNDTLFLAFHNPIKDDYYHYDIDTILYFENGLYDTYRLPTGRGMSIYYGRGAIEFNYKPWANHFYDKKEYASTLVKGDPQVDEIIIKY